MPECPKGAEKEGSLTKYAWEASQVATEAAIVAHLTASAQWLSAIADPLNVAATAAALLEAVDRSPQPLIFLGSVSAHPGKIVALHGVGTFRTPPVCHS